MHTDEEKPSILEGGQAARKGAAEHVVADLKVRHRRQRAQHGRNRSGKHVIGDRELAQFREVGRGNPHWNGAVKPLSVNGQSGEDHRRGVKPLDGNGTGELLRVNTQRVQPSTW